MKYKLYVDETGDTGLNKVRQGIDSKGATPFLVFGGCLVPISRESELRRLLSDIRSELNKKALHCTKLSHFETARFARRVLEDAGVLLFAFVSKKETLGAYQGLIAGKGQDQRYYNKCVSYFLERVGHFMIENEVQPDQMDIVFEKRDGHDYEKLRNYIRKVQRNPHDPRLGHFLAPIVPSRIVAVGKKEEDLLEFADLVAFSVSAAVTPSKANFGMPEQRYIRELKGKFFRDKETGVIGDFGLKIFKRHSSEFTADTRTFLESWHDQNVVPRIAEKC